MPREEVRSTPIVCGDKIEGWSTNPICRGITGTGKGQARMRIASTSNTVGGRNAAELRHGHCRDASVCGLLSERCRLGKHRWCKPAPLQEANEAGEGPKSFQVTKLLDTPTTNDSYIACFDRVLVPFHRPSLSTGPIAALVRRRSLPRPAPLQTTKDFPV